MKPMPMKPYTALNVPDMKWINDPIKNPKVWSAISLFSGCGGGSTGVKLAQGDVLYASEFIPSARRSYQANASPNTYVDGRDIRLVTGAEILKRIGLRRGQLDFMESSPPCFPAGRLVRTIDGMIPIEDIRVGDHVLTHMGRFRRVMTTMSRYFDGELAEISTRGATRIPSTLEHPYLVRRRLGKTREWSPPEWINAGDIRRGDRVAIQLDRDIERMPPYEGIVKYSDFDTVRRVFRKETVVKTLPLDDTAFWYIIGRFLGDGWIRGFKEIPKFRRGRDPRKLNRVAMMICCKGSVLDGGEEIREITSRMDRLGWKYDVGDRKGTASSVRITVWSQELAIYCHQFGRGASEKYMTGDIFNLPRRHLSAVVKGYMEADGCKAKNRTGHTVYRYRGTSRRLIVGMAYAIAKVTKIPSNGIYQACGAGECEILGRTVQHQAQWALVTGIDPGLGIRPANFEVDDDHHRIWAPVRHARREAFSGTVYNFSVKDDETYTVDGILVHNCKAYSSAARHNKIGKRADEEVLYSDNVRQRVDDLFDQHIRIMKEIMPRLCMIENVVGLSQSSSAGTFVEIVERLTEAGYQVRVGKIDPTRLGVPQTRIRLVFMCIRNDLYARGLHHVWPRPYDTPVVTVRDVISSARQISRGKGEWRDARTPSPTLTVTAGRGDEFSGLSAAPFYRDAEGTMLQYSIPQMKLLFGFPTDFRLGGRFIQRYERLARAHAPLAVYNVAGVILRRMDEVLGTKYANPR